MVERDRVQFQGMFYVRSVTASSCLVKTLRLDFAGKNVFACVHIGCRAPVRTRCATGALARRERCADRDRAPLRTLAPLIARPKVRAGRRVARTPRSGRRGGESPF